MALNIAGLINATNLSSATKLKILNNYCIAKGYQETISGQANPETKTDFFNRTLSAYIKEIVVSQAANAVANTVSTNETNTVNAEIVL